MLRDAMVRLGEGVLSRTETTLGVISIWGPQSPLSSVEAVLQVPTYEQQSSRMWKCEVRPKKDSRRKKRDHERVKREVKNKQRK